MKVRSETPPGDPSADPEPSERPAARAPVAPGHGRAAEILLRSALAVSLAGALLSGLAPAVGVVTPPTPPGFLSWPLLLAVGLPAPVLALWFSHRHRRSAAAAVLMAQAVPVPGVLLMQAQLRADAGLAVRPALLLPHDLEPLAPAPGFWLLAVGAVATGAAGILAVLAARASVPPDGSDAGQESGERAQRLLVGTLLATILAATGALMARFAYAGPYLLPHPALDSPPLVLAGSLLLAACLPVAGGLAVSSADPDTARGGLLGLALGLAAFALPALISVALLAEVRLGWGPVLEVVAAAGLAVLAVPAGSTGAARGTEVTRQPDDLALPASGRMLTATGVLGICTGLAAVLGALAPQVDMPPQFEQLPVYAGRMLLAAGAVAVILGGAMFLPRWSASVRPALAVSVLAVPSAAAAVLDTVLTAVQATGADVGTGTWAAVSAVLLAVGTVIVAALAGAVERDDADLTEQVVRRGLLVLCAVAALAALAAFGLPVLTAPDYAAPTLLSGFGLSFWGMLAMLAAVLVALALAPVARPARAVALLAGAVVLVLVRASRMPLTADRVEAAAAGPGLWAALACAVLVLAALPVARSSANRPDV